jgi:hypothetical protein
MNAQLEEGLEAPSTSALTSQDEDDLKMGGNEPSPSSRVVPRSTNLITSINHNDVLMGRGTGLNDFTGNQRFRSLAEQRKEDYASAYTNTAKRKIVNEVLDHIHELGGRFLKPSEAEKPVNNVVEVEVWCVVEENVALEKCKQKLRKKENQGALVGRDKRIIAGEATF